MGSPWFLYRRVVVTISRMLAATRGCHREPEKKNVKKVCSSPFQLENIGNAMEEAHSYDIDDG